jgi:hypothetical protein
VSLQQQQQQVQQQHHHQQRTSSISDYAPLLARQSNSIQAPSTSASSSSTNNQQSQLLLLDFEHVTSIDATTLDALRSTLSESFQIAKKGAKNGAADKRDRPLLRAVDKSRSIPCVRRQIAITNLSNQLMSSFHAAGKCR